MKFSTLVTRTALISLAQALARSSQLIVALVLVRYLTKEDWASLALLLTIYMSALNLGSLNLQQGVLSFHHTVPKEEREDIVGLVTVLLSVAGLATAAIVAFLLPVWVGPAIVSKSLLLWIALALACEIPTLSAGQILLAQDRPYLCAVYESFFAVAQVAAIVTPVLLGLGLAGVGHGLTVYGAFKLIVFLLVFLRRTRTRLGRAFVAKFRPYLVFSAPLAIGLGASVLNRHVDKWLVAALDQPHFGGYAIAAQEVSFVSLLPYAMSATLATRLTHAFATNALGRARQYWLAQVSSMTLVVLPVTMAIVVCAQELLALLFTDRYTWVTSTFQIFSLILFHRVAEYGLILRAAGKPGALLRAGCVLLLVNIAFSLPLTWWFGMTGAALGTLAAQLCAWLYVLKAISDVLRVRFSQAFPWPFYFRVMGASGAGAALAVATAKFVQHQPAWLALLTKLSVFSLTTVLLLRVLRIPSQVTKIPTDDPAFNVGRGGGG